MNTCTVKIILCAKSFALSRFENVGVWEILEIKVPEDQYDARNEEAITRPFYKDGVVFVGVYSWME